MKQKSSISATLDTLHVYSFSGDDGVFDQLPMKLKKNTEGVSNYLFLYLEKTPEINTRKCIFLQTTNRNVWHEPRDGCTKRQNKRSKINEPEIPPMELENPTTPESIDSASVQEDTLGRCTPKLIRSRLS